MSWQKAGIWDSPSSTAVIHKLCVLLSTQCLQLHRMHTVPVLGATSLCVLSNLSLPLHFASPLSFAPGEPLEEARSPPDVIGHEQG